MYREICTKDGVSYNIPSNNMFGSFFEKFVYAIEIDSSNIGVTYDFDAVPLFERNAKVANGVSGI